MPEITFHLDVVSAEGLLVDISHTGLASGIESQLFKIV